MASTAEAAATKEVRKPPSGKARSKVTASLAASSGPKRPSICQIREGRRADDDDEDNDNDNANDDEQTTKSSEISRRRSREVEISEIRILINQIQKRERSESHRVTSWILSA